MYNQLDYCYRLDMIFHCDHSSELAAITKDKKKRNSIQTYYGQSTSTSCALCTVHSMIVLYKLRTAQAHH